MQIAFLEGTCKHNLHRAKTEWSKQGIWMGRLPMQIPHSDHSVFSPCAVWSISHLYLVKLAQITGKVSQVDLFLLTRLYCLVDARIYKRNEQTGSFFFEKYSFIASKSIFDIISQGVQSLNIFVTDWWEKLCKISRMTCASLVLHYALCSTPMRNSWWIFSARPTWQQFMPKESPFNLRTSSWSKILLGIFAGM